MANEELNLENRIKTLEDIVKRLEERVRQKFQLK